MRILIRSGANINSSTSQGLSPLFIAVRFLHIHEAKELILLGAKFNDRDVNMRFKDIFEGTTLLNRVATLNVHDWGPGNSQAMVADRILALDVNVNAQDQFGYTPLALAVDHRCEQMVRCLLSHGADSNMLHRQGDSGISRFNKLMG